MSNWIEIGGVDDIPLQGSRIVATESGNVAIFRTVADEFYAVRDRCPHKGGPLSQGIVHGRRVACPLHNWVIELESGQAVTPDVGKTACFPVEVRERKVWVKFA